MYCKKCGKAVIGNMELCVNCSHCGKNSMGEGSFWIGFILVWFVGLIGLIIAYAMKQSETWRGAKFCFKLIIIILVVAFAILGVVTFVLMQKVGYNYYY